MCQECFIQSKAKKQEVNVPCLPSVVSLSPGLWGFSQQLLERPWMHLVVCNLQSYCLLDGLVLVCFLIHQLKLSSMQLENPAEYSTAVLKTIQLISKKYVQARPSKSRENGPNYPFYVS